MAGIFFSISTADQIKHLSAEVKEREITQSVPQSNFYLEREGYCLNYDGRLKQASWVYEELTKERLLNSLALKYKFNFKEDLDLPAIVRSTINDYHHSKFDRGHLACAANQKYNETAYAETFYLSNISPQAPELNRTYWLKLERYTRKLAFLHSKVTIVTGPLFLPQMDKEGKNLVQYEVIGPNQVAVPTHYFKIIFTPLHSEAFIVPNERISINETLTKYRESVEKVQKLAGLHFKLISSNRP